MKNLSIWLILILTAALRIGYWIEVHDEAWFIAPGADPDYYLKWAKDILDRNISNYLPFPRAPLYPFIAAGIQKIFGSGWLWLRLFNLICDLLTVSLIYRIAALTRDRRTGLIAAVIFALSGASIYFTGEVLMTSLATLAMTWILSALVTIKDNNAPMHFFSSGIGMGIMALLRPNILLLLPFTTAYAFFYPQNTKGIRFKVKISLIHSGTAILIILPVLITNYDTSGRIIPVSTQGGVNFLIGNVRGADGWSSTLPSTGPSWSTDDAHRLASRYTGKELSEFEVSTAFWKMGWDEITADLKGWISIMIKKMLLFINFREIGNNRPLLLPKDASILFSFLSLTSLGFIFPLALIGIIRFWKSDRVRVLGFLTLLYSFTIILFFVTTRYRTPIFPAFAILAALGITEVLNSRRAEKRFFQAMFIFLAGGLLSFPSWAGKDFDNDVQAKFIAGNAHLRLKQSEKALELFQSALAIDPNFYELNLNTGVALLSLGDTNEAEDAFRNEIRHWQESPKAYNNLGVIWEGRGEINEAIRFYKRSLNVDGSFLDARSNLARIYLMQGDVYAVNSDMDSAAILYNLVLAVNGASAGLLHRLAIIELKNNNSTKVEQLLRDGLKLDPGFEPTRNLLREMKIRE